MATRPPSVLTGAPRCRQPSLPSTSCPLSAQSSGLCRPQPHRLSGRSGAWACRASTDDKAPQAAEPAAPAEPEQPIPKLTTWEYGKTRDYGVSTWFVAFMFVPFIGIMILPFLPKFID